MINTLLGIKGEMSSGYDARGRRVAVTKIKVQSNFVTQLKTPEKDGYSSIQIATGSKKSVNKPQKAHYKKLGLSENLRYVREVRTEESADFSLGQELKVNSVFKKGDSVKVTGVSKGKGFQGGVRRHGFHGGPKTHGQSDRHRAPGSIGTGTTPGRVLKGKRMAGHMGFDTSSVRNLEVISVSPAKNEIQVKGAVPGPSGSMVIITKLGQIKGYIVPPEEKEEEEVLSDVEQMEASGTAEVDQVQNDAESAQAQTAETEAAAEPLENQEPEKTEEVKEESEGEK